MSQGDKRRPLDATIDKFNQMDADVPRSLQAKANEIINAEHRAFKKEEDARSLFFWLKQRGMGEDSRPIKLGDHKDRMKKWSLDKWIKKNQD